MSLTLMTPFRCGPIAMVMMVLAMPSIAEENKAPDPAMDTVALSVEGINPTSGEDNPGILYILPWQPPSLPGRSRDALDANAPELLEPVDPVALQRHQKFQKSLNPATDSTNSLR